MCYVVLNCPACYKYNNKYSCENNHDEQGRDDYCENVDDCIIKEIIEQMNIYKDMHAVTLTDYARREVALKVLDKLKIKKVKK